MKTMLKKLRDWMSWIFTKDMEESKKKEKSQEGVHYFQASWFFNSLDNEDDYYLKIVPGGENEFVRKDEVDDN